MFTFTGRIFVKFKSWIRRLDYTLRVMNPTAIIGYKRQPFFVQVFGMDLEIRVLEQ